MAKYQDTNDGSCDFDFKETWCLVLSRIFVVCLGFSFYLLPFVYYIGKADVSGKINRQTSTPVTIDWEWKYHNSTDLLISIFVWVLKTNSRVKEDTTLTKQTSGSASANNWRRFTAKHRILPWLYLQYILSTNTYRGMVGTERIYKSGYQVESQNEHIHLEQRNLCRL